MKKGMCLCGSVTIKAQTISHNIGVCHCSFCRKWTGGPLLAVESKGSVEFEGQEFIERYKSSDWAERGFCKKCGSHLFYHLFGSDGYILPVGLFSEDEKFVLEHQIFIEEKPKYYNFAEKTKNMTGAEVFAEFSES